MSSALHNEKSYEELIAKYLQLRAIIDRNLAANLIERGQVKELELLIDDADKEAAYAGFGAELAKESANLFQNFEARMIETGISADDIWHMEPIEFVEKHGAKLVVKMWLCDRDEIGDEIAYMAGRLHQMRNAMPHVIDKKNASSKGAD